MPVSFSSPPRNLFLLGTSGQLITNFFLQIDESASSNYVHQPVGIRYYEEDSSEYYIGGHGDRNSPSSNRYGWLEQRKEDGTKDWGVELSSTTSSGLRLEAIEFDGDARVIVAVGSVNNAPFIAKYDSSGGLDWQTTSQTADVTYYGVAIKNGNYYVCGSTDYLNSVDHGQSFVEKFDFNGTPGWGKSAFMLGRDVVLSDLAVNSRDEVIAVGYLEDDSANKGYIVKLDSATGDVLWDRTLELSSINSPTSGDPVDVEITSITIDDEDHIYVVGNIDPAPPFGSGTTPHEAFIVKYSPEGNILWQSMTEKGSANGVYYNDVVIDNVTKKPSVIGRVDYQNISGPDGVLISRYNANGSLSWRREIKEDTFSFRAVNASGDGDQSFVYLVFNDASDPEKYVFGKISATGNGLGDFEYDDGTGTPYLDYITTSGPNGSGIGETIGRLSDGSVRNDTTDLITYPFNANKILFDDFATQVSNKKRQMDDADSFEYSGSPAIRPADFQELNLLGTNKFSGDNYISWDSDNLPNWTVFNSGNGDTITGSGVFGDQIVVTRQNGSSYAQVGLLIPTVPGKSYEFSISVGNTTGNGGILRAAEAEWMTNGQQTSSLIKSVSGSNSFLTLSFIATGTETAFGLSVNDPGSADFLFPSAREVAWEDVSGKGNDGLIVGPRWNFTRYQGLYQDGYFDFDGTDGDLMRITMGSPLIPATGPWTAEGWVYLNNTDQTKMFMTQYQSGGDAGRFQMFFANDGTIRMHDGNGIMTGSLADCPSYSANEWTHVVWQHNDNNENMIYVNGVKATSDDQQTTTSLLQVDTLIGSRYDLTGGVNFDGRIGEVRVYPRALTAAQVFQNYNATKSTYIEEPPVIAPKIGPTIVYNDLTLYYDFTNKATYDARTKYYSTIDRLNYHLTEENIDAPDLTFQYGSAVVLNDDATKVVISADSSGGEAFVRDLISGTEIKWNEPTASGSINNGEFIAAGGGRVAFSHTMAATFPSTHYIYLYDEDLTNELIINNGYNTNNECMVIYDEKLYVTAIDPNNNNELIRVYDIYTGTKTDEWGAGLYSVKSIAIGFNRIAVANSQRQCFIHYLNGTLSGGATPSGLTLSNSDYGQDPNSIAIGLDSSGNPRLYVGDPQHNDNAGRVYSFDLSGNDQQIIESPNSEKRFGQSIDADNGILIIGSPNNESFSGTEPGEGSVYVLGPSGSTILTPSSGGDERDYACSVAIKKNKIVVGARNEPGGNSTGAIKYYKIGFESDLSNTVNNLASEDGSYPGTIDGATFDTMEPGTGYAGFFDFGTTSQQHIIETTGTNCSTLLGTLDSGGSCTMECWVKLNDTFTRQTILSGYVAGDNSRWDLEVDTGNLVFTRHSNGSTTATGGISAFNWNYVAVTRGDGSDARIRIYLNGSEVGTSLLGGPLGSAVPLGIGWRSDGSSGPSPLNGLIGEVRTYTQALSATEVSQHWLAIQNKYGITTVIP